ncbi:MAG TPA: AAA family ATPase, partial [Thermoanaerobaculia bacterium]|nr:AAA family ATPase [Thermoanaerobaculia bacterium]
MALAAPAKPRLPPWAERLIALYSSQTANQFILYGNVNDRFVLPIGDAPIGTLYDFLMRVMMPRFDVVISYDLGNGVRIDKGGEVVSRWPAFRETTDLPRAPRAAVEFLTRLFRYSANVARLGQPPVQVGFIMKAAHLVAPAVPGALNYDLNALALLIRDWSADELLTQHQLVTWLIADNRNDLHALLVNNPRAAAVEIPLPSSTELANAVTILASRYPDAAAGTSDASTLAGQLIGSTLGSVENLLKIKHHERKPLAGADLVALRKELVERDASGLIDFIQSSRTLDDVYAQDRLKSWLRQDIALWRMNDLQAMPMGYLICGPVGTGKTYLVECLAGEAGIPVVKIKNFRDKWVGSTEGNLEKIFRLLQGLGRCFVFIDEADQALGRRDAGTSDSGLSGRIYSMFAEQMSDTSNRGRIVWVLASSRPDLIEVDLKRPGRIDVKIPVFPSTTIEESLALIRALTERRDVAVTDQDLADIKPMVPLLLTPGAAEAIAVKVYRTTRTEKLTPIDALKRALNGYQNPVPSDVMQFQIELAAKEATDVEFVPEEFR